MIGSRPQFPGGRAEICRSALEPGPCLLCHAVPISPTPVNKGSPAPPRGLVGEEHCASGPESWVSPASSASLQRDFKQVTHSLALSLLVCKTRMFHFVFVCMMEAAEHPVTTGLVVALSRLQPLSHHSYAV